VTPFVSVDVGVNVSEGSEASMLPLEPSFTRLSLHSQ
jgi:hypothetical protein